MFTTSGIIEIGSTVIEAEQITVTPNNQTESINSGGFTSPLDVVSVGAKPTISFTTKNISAILGFSLLVNSLATDAINVYLQTVESGGTVNGKCTKISMTSGIFVIDSLSLALGSVATATCTIYPSSSNGSNSPFTQVDETSTFPTYSKNETWAVVGSATINGTLIPKTTNIEVTLGHTVQQEITQGMFYPVDNYVLNYNPQITINTLDQKSARTLLGDQGKKLTTGGCVITLNSVSATGVLTSTTAHTLTVHEGLAVLGDRQYSSGSRAESAIVVHCAYSDSSAAIEVA